MGAVRGITFSEQQQFELYIQCHSKQQQWRIENEETSLNNVLGCRRPRAGERGDDRVSRLRSRGGELPARHAQHVSELRHVNTLRFRAYREPKNRATWLKIWYNTIERVERDNPWALAFNEEEELQLHVKCT